MAQQWILEPLIGVGPLRFGMTKNDVAQLEKDLGPVYAEFEENAAEGPPMVQQARDMEAPVLYFRENRLTGIQLDMHSRFDIRFAGLSVFGDQSRNILLALERANGGAMFGLGAVLFPALSVSTNGFFAGQGPDGKAVFWDKLPDPPAKVVNVEMKSAYDAVLRHYAPISFVEK